MRPLIAEKYLMNLHANHKIISLWFYKRKETQMQDEG